MDGDGMYWLTAEEMAAAGGDHFAASTFGGFTIVNDWGEMPAWYFGLDDDEDSKK